MPLVIGFIVLILFLAVLIAVFIKKILDQRVFLKLLSLRLISVKLPKKRKEETKDFKDELQVMGQLLKVISGVKIPAALEVAVHNIGEEIAFYVAVPASAIDFIIKQIHGFWPSAQVEKTEDYTIFNGDGEYFGAYFKQKESYTLPIRTYDEIGVDTFSPILSHFSQLKSIGEGLAIQVMIKPAPSSVKKTIVKYIDQLKTPKAKKGQQETLPTLTTETEEKIKAAQQKLNKPIFAVNYRIIASSATKESARAIVDGVVDSFSSLSSPLRNELRPVKPSNPKRLIDQYIFRKFDNDQTMILGLDELVSIFHFPTSQTEIPQIKWAGAKEAEPPAILPKSGVQIGETSFRGDHKPVRLSDDDRRRHLYIIGQTGTGKSNLLTSMAQQDIDAGKGVCVVDPHGDLIDAILRTIPARRVQDVIVFDPADYLHPIGLNMLEYDPQKPEQKTFIVNEMQSIFNRLFAQETMGPVFEQYMRNTLLLLMDNVEERATLVEVPRVLTDEKFRKRLLEKAANPTVIDFWTKEAEKAGGEAALNNMAPYITSKFNNFIANDYVRPIIGQPESAFNFRKVMDNGQILLVNLSKGRIGDINANLLGMIIVGKLLMAALSRVDISEQKRRDFYLYIDEFQNFSTDSIATILSEARKYRLNLTLAHQFIAQLPEKIRDAVFGNVGSMLVFRIGADDAEYLEKQFAPVFSKDDLLNIGNYQAYAKLLIGGKTSKAFNIRTLPAKAGEEDVKKRVIDLVRAKYAANRQEVEEDIVYRLRT